MSKAKQMKSKHALSLRLDKTTFSLLAEASRQREESYSTFIRRAILVELARLSLLEPNQVRALGLSAQEI